MTVYSLKQQYQKTILSKKRVWITVAISSAIFTSFSVSVQASTTDFTKSVSTEPKDSGKAKVEWSTMATAHSPAQPITEFIDGWRAPLDKGKHAYAQGRMALDIKPMNSAISYGLGWRYDYLMRFSPETAQVYWQYENKASPTSAEEYPLYLEAVHNERVGANIGYSYQLAPNWQLQARGNLWQGLHALEGEIKGQLSSQALEAGANIRDSVNNADLFVDYYYDEPALGEENLNWHPDDPKGYGYSLDLQLSGKLNEATSVEVAGYDLAGRMKWRDMPSTRYALDYDVNDRPLYTLEGQLLTKDVTQTLPWRIEGSIRHQLNPQWQLGAHAQVNDIQTLYQLSAGYHPINSPIPIKVTGLVEPQTKAIGVAVDSKFAGIKVIMDDIKFDEAKRSEISLYGRYEW